MGLLVRTKESVIGIPGFYKTERCNANGKRPIIVTRHRQFVTACLAMFFRFVAVFAELRTRYVTKTSNSPPSSRQLCIHTESRRHDDDPNISVPQSRCQRSVGRGTVTSESKAAGEESCNLRADGTPLRTGQILWIPKSRKLSEPCTEADFILPYGKPLF